MYQFRFRQLTHTIVLQVFYAVALMMTIRLIMSFSFLQGVDLGEYSQDIVRMLSTGIRYDFRVATIAFELFYLVGMLAALHHQVFRIYLKALPWVGAVIFFIIAATSISNYYYFETYQNHFDLFVFGLVDDDTSAVIGNMWQDYPLLTSSLMVVLLAGLGGALSQRWVKEAGTPVVWKKRTMAVYALSAITLFSVASRGSLGTFPLRRANAQVSDLTTLNKLTPNALMALDWANKDRKKDIAFQAVSQAEGEALMTAALNTHTLVETTPENAFLAANKPNVVLAIMESMGSNLLAFDDVQQNDLLGRLRPHFKSDFLYQRFVSAGNGTAPSVAALLFNSPVQSISHSSAQTTVLQGNAFQPFQRADYNTVFISPGNMMWRNLNNYLPIQGVDVIYDQNYLMKVFPESKRYMTDWGLPDEYAFKLAEKLLLETTTPLFITILSVTNHPPYVTPDSYQPAPVRVSKEYQQRAGGGEIELDTILTTFQYSADALGQFITAIKSSPLGDHTLVAATGDHQMRRVLAKVPEESVLDKAVPFYLYVPSRILDQVNYTFDPRRPGSHKDIFPTLYHHSLSSAQYTTIGGRNLLSPMDQSSRNFGYNSAIMVTDKGAISLEGDYQQYLWQEPDSLKLGREATPVDEKTQAFIEAFIALQRWHINKEVKGLQ